MTGSAPPLLAASTAARAQLQRVSLTDDGRFVAFRSMASILVVDDDNARAGHVRASALEAAWDDANSIPMGVTRGCILVTTPGCRQLQYPDGFASVYDAEGLLNLPAPVLIIVRNLESGGTAVFVANFVAYEGDDDQAAGVAVRAAATAG